MVLRSLPARLAQLVALVAPAACVPATLAPIVAALLAGDSLAVSSAAAQRAPEDSARRLPHAEHSAPAAGSDTTGKPLGVPTPDPTMPGMTMPGMEMSGPDAARTARMTTAPGMQAMMHGPLGLPMTRTGSGTTWMPDSTPLYARMIEAGSWGLMVHGVAFGQYDHQGGPRGASQLGSVNWGMLMAARNLGRATADGGSAGRLQLRGMMSLEPFTVGGRGYPLLLQTGEAYQGQPLHDRQHPHDLFMEIAALYERPLAPNLGLQLYLAPVGEPALGPVAFPHRPSAASDPFATLGHHWQDATHISFGVLTAGLFTRTVKLEASIFNGREPDDVRTNFDYKGRSLDSYAGRLSVNPSPYVSLSAAYGYLRSPEALHPEESVHRTTLSALYGRPFRARGTAAISALYGINRHAGVAAPSGGLEGLLDLDGTNTLFTRVERVRKTGEELAFTAPGLVGAATAIPTAVSLLDPSQPFSVSSLTLGYVREVARGVRLLRGMSLGVGLEGTVNRVPASLAAPYGSQTPRGFAVYLRLRPSRMTMDMRAMAMPGSMAPHATAVRDPRLQNTPRGY